MSEGVNELRLRRRNSCITMGSACEAPLTRSTALSLSLSPSCSQTHASDDAKYYYTIQCPPRPPPESVPACRVCIFSSAAAWSLRADSDVMCQC